MSTSSNNSGIGPNRMEKETIVFHIGYHKSASTYLQKRVFPKLPVNFVFLAGYKGHLLDLVASKEHFDNEYFLQWINQEIERKSQQQRHNITIVSHEQLSGHPHGDRRINPYTIADNLKHAFPAAKILIIIRNQWNYLLSIYTYRVAIKGEEARGLIKFLREEGDTGLFEKLEYDRLVEYYMSLFGADNVLVLPLELLKTDPAGFHEKIAELLPVDQIPFKRKKVVNESTKLSIVIHFWRPINFLFNGLLKFLQAFHIETQEEYPYQRLRYAFYRFKQRVTRQLNRGFRTSGRLCIPPDIEEAVLLTRYQESNGRLEKLTNLDLRSLGYPVCSNELRVPDEGG
jgi:hypothetical protein